MIKPIIIVLIILLSSLTSAQAQDELPDPGITPDSFLYPIDVFFDDARLVLTFGEEAKNNRRLQIAEERLAEVLDMAKNNNTQGIEKAIEQHNRIMEKMQTKMNVSDNATENLKLQLQLEEKIRIHEEKMLHINTELVPEKQGSLNDMLNCTGLLKKDIQQEKNSTMEKIDNSDQVEYNLKTELNINTTSNTGHVKKVFQKQ